MQVHDDSRWMHVPCCCTWIAVNITTATWCIININGMCISSAIIIASHDQVVAIAIIIVVGVVAVDIIIIIIAHNSFNYKV
jgi:hypothetical protein